MVTLYVFLKKCNIFHYIIIIFFFKLNLVFIKFYSLFFLYFFFCFCFGCQDREFVELEVPYNIQSKRPCSPSPLLSPSHSVLSRVNFIRACCTRCCNQRYQVCQYLLYFINILECLCTVYFRTYLYEKKKKKKTIPITLII